MTAIDLIYDKMLGVSLLFVYIFLKFFLENSIKLNSKLTYNVVSQWLI